MCAKSRCRARPATVNRSTRESDVVVPVEQQWPIVQPEWRYDGLLHKRQGETGIEIRLHLHAQTLG